jgi:peptide-N4-(N-acetyl-beta-glucosaminyl)asparagine amidase
VFSFGLHDVVDVAPRYAADWSAMRERRTWVPEGWLSLTLATINATRQAGLPAEAKATLAQRAAAEAEQLAELQLSVEARDATAAAKASAGMLLGDREAEARGRQTGSLKWRAARGELGPRSE